MDASRSLREFVEKKVLSPRFLIFTSFFCCFMIAIFEIDFCHFRIQNFFKINYFSIFKAFGPLGLSDFWVFCNLKQNVLFGS